MKIIQVICLIPITLIVSKATRDSKNLEVTKVWKEFLKLIEKYIVE